MKNDIAELSASEIESVAGGESWYAWGMHLLNPNMPACHYDNDCHYQMTGVKG